MADQRQNRRQGEVSVPGGAQPSSNPVAPAEAPQSGASIENNPVSGVEANRVRQLEQELAQLREDYLQTIDQVQNSNEELQTSNEEIRVLNEELQSANEELRMINNQLQDKVQELETSNNDLANLINATDIATIFLDRAFHIKRFTPASRTLFRFIPADVGRPISNIAMRFSDSSLLTDAERVLREFSPLEKEVVTDAGYWYVRRILPYCTRDHRIDGVVITFVDITERKQTADALIRRLAAIVESSADAIFSKDLDGTIRTWNAAAERLYGYTADEIVGQSIRVTVPAERLEEWSEEMARAGRGEHVQQLETERLRKDGQCFPVEMTYSPLRDHRGKTVGISGTARDISERKRAQRDLMDREERLQAILNTVWDAIVTIDHCGIIQSVNRRTEEMFGYTAAELIGQNVSMLMPSPYQEEHDEYVARYLRTRQKRIIGTSRETEAQRKDGTVFSVDLAVSEIEHLNLFTGIHRDLTERKQLERDVVEAASQEQRRIGQDLHDSVAQELTALNLLASDLAEMVRTDPERALQLVERMDQGLERSQRELRAVLRGLLPVAVDSEGLMAALTDLVDRTQQDRKVGCTFDCPEPVAVADNLAATHLYLIALEAVNNAVRHASGHNVLVRLQQTDARLALDVQDDGCGMPTQPVESQGLGLRIMRNRAAIIGAILSIEPASPTGTLVRCILTRKAHEQEKEQSSTGSDRG
jgi:PAS domain S-box-containing protein